MKRKHLFLACLAIAALLAAGGLWLARSAWRAHASDESSMGADFKTPDGRPMPGQTLNPPNPDHTHAPPEPTRKFREFTPEQRVEFARKGHGPGG